MPAPVGDDFRAFYGQIKDQQQALGLGADATLVFAPRAAVGGDARLRRVLHLQPGDARPGDQPRAPRGGPDNQVHDALYGAIERQYGTNTATRVFARVFDGAPPTRVTLAHLERIHDEVMRNRSFSDIAGDVQHLRGASHLRYRARTDDDPDAERVGLYVNTDRNLPFSKEWRQQTRLRRAAGHQVWQAIADEHGRAVADSAFRNVFGRRLDGHEQDHRVTVTVDDVGRLKRDIERQHGFSFPAPGRTTFSQVLGAVDARRQGMEDNTPVLYDSTTGAYRVATGGAGLPPAARAGQEAATGAAVQAALIREVGPAAAGAILRDALPDADLAGAARVTVGDLDRIRQAKARALAPALRDIAELDRQLQADVAADALDPPFAATLARHGQLVGRALDGAPEPQAPAAGLIRATLAMDAFGRARRGEPGAARDCCALVGADPARMPDGARERERWLADRFHERFFAPPGRLGLDPAASPDHRNWANAVAYYQRRDDASGAERMIAMQLVMNRLLDEDDGARRKAAVADLHRALHAFRDADAPPTRQRAEALRQEALKAADGRRVGRDRDDHNQPRADKTALLRELARLAGDGGPVTATQRAAVAELDRETASLQLRRAGQQLAADEARLAQDNIGRFRDAPAEVERALLPDDQLAVALAGPIRRVARLVESGIARDEHDLRDLVNLTLPANARVRESLALMGTTERLQMVSAALYPGRTLLGRGAERGARAERRRVMLVADLLLRPALETLHSRGDRPLRDDGSLIRFQGRTYQRLRKLGSGAFGTAFLYESTAADQQGQRAQIVVKQFRPRDPKRPDHYNDAQKTEIRGHLEVSHPGQAGNPGGDRGRDNVLTLQGYLFAKDPAANTGTFMTVTPVASGGELADVIDRINTARDRGDLSDNAALLLKRRLLGQTAAGMAYVQGRRMMHKDLKGENVFVTADGTAKVADFGMAAPGLDAKRSGGTPGYMAPEVTARYTRKGDQDKLPGAGSDVWSMGALMRRELFGTQVLPGTERVWRRTAGRRDKLMRQAVGAPQQDDYRIYRPGRPELTASHLDPMHTELKKVRDVNMLGAQEKLINAMMHPDPEQRPSMQAVAGHAFFNDPMLDEPALQQLTAALIAGAGQQEIRRLGSAVDAIGKRA